MSSPILLGRLIQLQLQRTPLKQVTGAGDIYDPAGLLVVPEATLTRRGVFARGPDGARVTDIHHADHPETRQSSSGSNGISLGFTPYYAAMRARFGAHMVDGCAGENLLIETADRVLLPQLAGGLAIETAGGGLAWLRVNKAAAPCRPFSRWTLRQDAPAPDVLKETLQFLDGGMRGFYASLRDPGEAVIAVGAQVFLPAA